MLRKFFVTSGRGGGRERWRKRGAGPNKIGGWKYNFRQRIELRREREERELWCHHWEWHCAFESFVTRCSFYTTTSQYANSRARGRGGKESCFVHVSSHRHDILHAYAQLVWPIKTLFIAEITKLWSRAERWNENTRERQEGCRVEARTPNVTVCTFAVGLR